MTDVNPTPLSDEEVLEIAESAAANAGMSGAEGVARKAKHFWPSFWRMMGLLKPYWIRMILVTVVGAASVVLTVLAPRILGRATDVLFSGYISNQIPSGVTTEQAIAGLRAAGQTEMADMVAKMDVTPGAGIDFNQLANILLLVLALYVGAAVFSWLQGYVLNRVMVRAMWKLRGEVEDKINRLPLSYFDRVKRGDLISRVTNDIDNMTNTLQQSMSGAITSVFTVIGALVMMLTISWQLTLIALVSFPLLGIIFGIIGPKSQKAFSLQWLKVGRLNARVEESFSGHALVKVFGQQKRFEREFAEENEELYQAAFKAQFLSGLMMPMMSFVGNLVYVGIAVVGAVMVAGGSLLLGSVQAFIQYSSLFNQPLAELGGMAASVQSGVASTERVYELLDEADEVPDNPDAPAPVEGQGRIEFEHVRFSYSPNKPLIEDLSFVVDPGQTVAIVGPTRAGKTTLVNLLMRFYDIQSGKITIDGHDIAAVSREDVRGLFGMVLQDTWLFGGTVADNVAYGKPEATREEIVTACDEAYCDHFIRTLPQGYDTVVSEDSINISGGQKQLLTIARALLANRRLLILDEATSNVETRTEILLQKAMDKLMRGRTCFVIAHLLSTIVDADLILVINDGQIVEAGTHEGLLEKQGFYYRLYTSQYAV